ncbi:MAG: archaetidylserine decarboxylase [Methylococcales bacterium]|nr:archaetidylserine decarboxylase [Methylococcales bacterium]
MSIKERFITLPQYILPHHALSKLMCLFTHCKYKAWKNWMISTIIKIYKVNMSEAREPDINAYASFNHFFTRELKEGARVIAQENKGIISPADGAVSQAGLIREGAIFQAKGKSFTVTDLLGGDELRAKPFNEGLFSTIYLSPKDYHRLHMPITGKLKEMIHVPGRLFSVNAATARSVPQLFARNERVVCIFETEIGEMALILVGAIFVSSIETVWQGVITPPTISDVRHWSYGDDAPVLKKGDEMGRFNMGSTIIVLFAKNKASWKETFVAGKAIKMGESIGTMNL